MTTLPIVELDSVEEITKRIKNTPGYFQLRAKELQKDNPVTFGLIQEYVRASDMFAGHSSMTVEQTDFMATIIVKACMSVYDTLEEQSQVNAQREVQSKLKPSNN